MLFSTTSGNTALGSDAGSLPVCKVLSPNNFSFIHPLYTCALISKGTCPRKAFRAGMGTQVRVQPQSLWALSLAGQGVKGRG